MEQEGIQYKVLAYEQSLSEPIRCGCGGGVDEDRAVLVFIGRVRL